MKTIDYRKDLTERLKANPEELKAYIRASMEYFDEDGDVKSLVLALRTAAEVKGGVCALARKIGLSPATLYKALSKQGNPTIGTVRKVLHGFDQGLALLSR